MQKTWAEYESESSTSDSDLEGANVERRTERLSCTAQPASRKRRLSTLVHQQPTNLRPNTNVKRSNLALQDERTVENSVKVRYILL